MSRSRKFSRRRRLRYCDQPGPGDGLDPRLEPQMSSHKVTNRKALQLCAQIRRTLGSVLAGECDDDVLRDLFVESVVPAPNSSQVLVTVYPATLGDEVSVTDILRRLDKVSGLLRCEVAAAIHRRKTPALLFRVLTFNSASKMEAV